MGSSRQLAVLALALGATACRGQDEPQYAGPYGDKIGPAIPQVERAVGLRFKTPPKVEERSKQQVREFALKELDLPAARTELAGMEVAYKALGLLPADYDLRARLIDILEEQVSGYYDPKTKTLYIVSGTDSSVAAITASHELVHALQDQYLNLDSIVHTPGDNDRKSAIQAVIEGQATFEQLTMMLGTPNHNAFGEDRVRQIIRDNPSQMERFAAAPTVIQETLLFPYLTGYEFMKRFEAKNPGKVPFDDLPQSVEQVMHADKYLGERDEPTRITLALVGGGEREARIAGASTTYENSLGEFETRLFLYQQLRDAGNAARAAAGWDGDRYVAFRTAAGDGVAWLTVWDTPVDAGEFYDVAGEALERRYGVKAAASGATRRAFPARGRSVSLSTHEVGGRPAVLYVDVPAGAPTDLIDLARVTLK